MRRESDEGHICPKCEETIYREECGCSEPSVDGMGRDLMQTMIEMAYLNYMRESTRNLIGHIERSSPLLRSHAERKIS